MVVTLCAFVNMNLPAAPADVPDAVVPGAISPYSRSMKGAIAAAALAAVLLIGGCATTAQTRSVAADFYDLGNAYADLGQYDKAIHSFQEAVRIDPSFTRASYNLALAYTRQKKTDEAIAILNRLLTADPQNTQVLSALGWSCHVAGRESEALQHYEAVLKLSPADQNALYDSGIILWKLEHRKEALDRFRSLLDRWPDDTDALFAAGSLALALDDPAGSEQFLSRYLDKKPADVEAWFMIAAGAERQRKFARALDAYEKIVSQNTSQADGWFGEARLLLTVVQDPQRGLEALNKSLAAGFKDAAAIKVLLDSTNLLERDAVEAALKARDLLPAAAPSAARQQSAPAAPGAAAPGAAPPAAAR
jgi:tetratricopeptide (TPR) repeat protein